VKCNACIPTLLFVADNTVILLGAGKRADVDLVAAFRES
jgi:hypothetical protein